MIAILIMHMVVVVVVIELAQLFHLGELAQDHVAFHQRDVIHERDAVGMVDLVLDAGGEQPGGLQFLRLSVLVEIWRTVTSSSGRSTSEYRGPETTGSLRYADAVPRTP